MDVYHKVLVEIYNLTDGKDSVDVDMTDLLKREGFYSNLQSITDHLRNESWVAEGSRPFVVRITHWGVAEARRVAANLPDLKELVSKDAGRLLNEGREFVIMLEDFAADPSTKKFETVSKRYSDLGEIVKRLERNL